MISFLGITFLLAMVGGQNGQKRSSTWYQKHIKTKDERNYKQVEKRILDTLMDPKVYDARIRPSGANDTDSATVVIVNIFVRSFSKIDDVKMEYTFQITMRQLWMDQRLQYEHIKEQQKIPDNEIRYLTMTDASRIWMPDTFFRNEKFGSFHTILQPNLYIRIFPDGNILYSIRVSLTAACSMHLALFPLDEQVCHLYIASYGWTKNDLVYEWYPSQPVQIPRNLTLPGGFNLGKTGNDSCDVITATGEYSCLQVDLTFKRQLSFFIVTVYIPCSMTVSVSWLSFWLDHKAVPARVALGVTTLLAMSTTQASIQNSLPPVAYTKAIDVWSGVCVVFVFSALLEYALVNYASRSDVQRAKKQKERNEQELAKCKFNAELMEDLTTGEDAAAAIAHDPLMRRLERCHMVPVGRPLQSGALSPHGHQLSSGPNGGHYLPASSGSQTNSAARDPSFHTSLGLAPGAQFPPGPRAPLLLTSCPPYPLVQGSPLPLVQVTSLGPAPHLPGQCGRQVKQNFIRRWCANRYRNFQFGAKKIDVFSRFGFPFVFFIFNIWYWSYYLTREHKQTKS